MNGDLTLGVPAGTRSNFLMVCGVVLPHRFAMTSSNQTIDERNVTRIVTATQISRSIRASLQFHLYDDSGGGVGHAVYTLSDPRDLQRVSYVGQTASPHRRYLQHVNQARLWLPNATPWWIKRPQLRPLYEWIRQLYDSERRLPVMIVRMRADPSQARCVERELISTHLAAGMPLLNVEPKLKRAKQIPLL